MELGVQTRQVEVWFQNRRARGKAKRNESDCEVLRQRCQDLIVENHHLNYLIQVHLYPPAHPMLSISLPSSKRSVFSFLLERRLHSLRMCCKRQGHPHNSCGCLWPQSERMGYDSRHLTSNGGPLLRMALCNNCKKLRNSWFKVSSIACCIPCHDQRSCLDRTLHDVQEPERLDKVLLGALAFMTTAEYHSWSAIFWWTNKYYLSQSFWSLAQTERLTDRPNALPCQWIHQDWTRRPFFASRAAVKLLVVARMLRLLPGLLWRLLSVQISGCFV